MDRQVNALDFSTSTVFKKVKEISRPVYRYPYFDTLKAIVIFMVVLQHCYNCRIALYLHDWILNSHNCHLADYIWIYSQNHF